MPFFEKITIENTTLFFWKITENQSELFSEDLLSEFDNQRFMKIKSENHRRSFLAVRHLLQKANINPQNLFYDNNGKPFLQTGQNISISHSHQFAMIALSSQKIGIDIEKKQERIKALAYRFTDWLPQENVTNSEKISAFIQIWAIKEALYKAINMSSVDFKKHLIIQDFSLYQNEFSAKIHHPNCQERYRIFSGEIEDFVWSLAIFASEVS